MDAEIVRPAKKTEPCIVKVDTDNHLCGLPVVYRRAGEDGKVYSGWDHLDLTVTGHGGVPSSWIG